MKIDNLNSILIQLGIKNLFGFIVFLYLCFILTIFSVKTENIVAVIDFYESNHKVQSLIVIFIIIMFLIDYIYIYYSIRKNFLERQKYVFGSIIYFILSISIIYFAILICLVIFNHFVIVPPTIQISSIDISIFLYTSIIFPVYKMSYDIIGNIKEDKANYNDTHIKFKRVKKLLLNGQNIANDQDLKNWLNTTLLSLKEFNMSLQEVKKDETNKTESLFCLNIEYHLSVLISFFSSIDTNWPHTKSDIHGFYHDYCMKEEINQAVSSYKIIIKEIQTISIKNEN
jgi:hypothetical protein